MMCRNERLTGNSIILRNIAIFLETFDAVADACGQNADQLLEEWKAVPADSTFFRLLDFVAAANDLKSALSFSCFRPEVLGTNLGDIKIYPEGPQWPLDGAVDVPVNSALDLATFLEQLPAV